MNHDRATLEHRTRNIEFQANKEVEGKEKKSQQMKVKDQGMNSHDIMSCPHHSIIYEKIQ